MSLPSYLHQDRSGAWLIHLWIQPKASRSGWAGMHGEWLKVRVAAPPAQGKANRELVRFLSRALQLAPTKLQVVAGASSRKKIVRLDALTERELLSRLPDH